MGETLGQTFRPAADRFLLGLLEGAVERLGQPCHAAPSGFAIVLLQGGEQSAVQSLGESPAQSRQGFVHQSAGLGGLGQTSAAVARGFVGNLVHADAPNAELGAGVGIDVRRHSHVHAQWRLAARVRGEALEYRAFEQRMSGPCGRIDDLDRRRLAPELVQGEEPGIEALRKCTAPLCGAIDDQERPLLVREGACGPFRHGRNTDQGRQAATALQTSAHVRQGHFGERHGPGAELRAVAHGGGEAQRFFEEQGEAGPAQGPCASLFVAGAHLAHHVRLADRRRVEPGGHEKQVLAGAFAAPSP